MSAVSAVAFSCHVNSTISGGKALEAALDSNVPVFEVDAPPNVFRTLELN